MPPTAQISQEQLHFLMNAAQGSLLNFAQVVDNRYEVERFHEIIADKLEECLESAIQKKKKRVILSIPPRHGKSELASIKFPAWALGKYPDLRFILSTYGSELSETNGMKTRDLISSEGFRSVFPKVRLKGDMKSKANWMVESTDPKGENYIGGYYAVGIGGAVTGKGADCFVGDTLILTKEGYKRIDSLDLLHTEVLSFNHEKNKLEWKRILASSKRDLRKTIRITTSTGDSFRCTADHRIFTKQRGYIRADDLQYGEELIGIQGFKKDICTSEVLSLSERVSKTKIRIRKMVQEKFERSVLFFYMLKTSSFCKKQEEVCNVQCTCCEEDKKILREKRMQKEYEKISKEGMSVLSYYFSTIKSYYKNMFKAMFSGYALRVNGWKKEPELQTWNGIRNISCGVLQNEEKDYRKRFESLFYLLFQRRDSMSSYRSQSKKQCDGELNNFVQKLSLETSLEQNITVSSIERDCEIENVYDIQVEDNNNFFANNVLVHNCLIIDDPHKDRAEAESETMRKLVWDYYRSTLRSRLEGHGVVILIMQRWRQDDLVGLLLEEDEKRIEAGEEPEGWEVISLPAIAEDDEYYKGELTRKQGEPLWEAKFPIAVLESIRQTSPYFWASQYQQNPILAETAEFKNEMFQYYIPDDLKYKNLRYYTLVDPAISQKTSADNTVVLTVAKEVDGPNFYRIREDAGRFTPQQTVDLIFVHQKEYHSDVWIETIAYQEALKYLVQTRQKKDQVYFVVHDIKSRTNKETRIRGLLGLYQNRVIWHLKGADTSYELELMAFPRGRRDDRADVMSQILLAQESMQGGSFAKQFKKKWIGYGRTR